MIQWPRKTNRFAINIYINPAKFTNTLLSLLFYLLCYKSYFTINSTKSHFNFIRHHPLQGVSKSKDGFY